MNSEDEFMESNMAIDDSDENDGFEETMEGLILHS